MAVATTLIEDEEPARKPNAATSLYETPGYEDQPSGERATTLIEDDPAARLDDLTYVPGDTDKGYDEWKEWVQGREDQDFGMDDAIAIGKTMVGELYDGGKAFIANAAEGEFRRIINSLGEGVLRGTADLGIIANKAVDKATRDDSYTRERYRGWREIRKLEAMREKARLGEEDIIDHLAFGEFQTDDVDVDPALAEGASYVTDIGTVVGGAARGAVRKGLGGVIQKGQTAVAKGTAKGVAKGMEVTGDLFQKGKSAIAERIPEIVPEYVERAARVFPRTAAAAEVVKGGFEKIGPFGSAIKKSVDELPEAPTGMGGLERVSKNTALPEPIRGAASRASKGDKVLRLGKDIGLGAGYGAAAGTALSAASADTDQEFYSGVMGGALTGGIGGAGGRVIDVLTGKDDAARMQSSIREFTKEHTGNNTAWNNLLERAGSETNARETVENIVTASEMLRGRVEVKVLEGEEFNRRAGSKGVDGFYDKDTKEIVIRSDGANPRDTLLHEVGEAMWDSGVVDVGVVKNEFIKNYGNLEDLKKAYAERMLQGETEGQPTKEQIDRRVRELDNKFKSENEDWVIRELFSENFMAESSGMGLHNFVRNNTKFGKIKRTVQALGRPLSNDVRIGKGALGGAMREVAATTFDVLGQIKGGKGIDGLGYAEGNIFGTQLKKTSKLSRAYKKYTKELNRQYKAAELGLETKRTVELNKADDAVDWDGPGKEYFDDAPLPKPKGKDKEGSQDTGGQKKAKDKKELRQRQRDRRKSVRDNIDVNPQDTSRDVVRPQYKHDDAGNIKPNVKRELRGKFLQGTYRDLPMMENFRGTIDTVNRAIENGQVLRSTYFGTGTRQGGDTWVNSLTKDKGNIPATEVDYLPFEWLVTSKGNVDVRVIDLSYIRGRAAKWKDTGKIDDWNGDVDSFMSDAKKYLENHRDGRPGETGLSETKHKIINAFFQANNRGKNEFYTMWDRASGTRIYKSLRVERIGRAKDTSAQGTPFGMLPFDHLKVKKMQSPTRMSPARPTPDVSPSKRELDSLGMYSKAQEAIEGMQQKRGTGQQYLKALEKAGVKSEEVQDIGLDTFLKDNPKTTQEEVLDFIKSNQVEMVEVTKNSRGQTLYKIEADHDDFPEFGWKSHQEAENYLKSYFEKVWLPEEIERYSAEERNSPELMEHLQEVFNDSHQISPETRGGFDIIDMWSRYGDDEPMPGSPFPSEQAALDARDAMHKEYNKAESGNFKIQRFMDLDESTRADYKSLLERFEGEYVITSQHDGQTVIESVEDALTFKDKGTAEDALYSLVENNFYDRYRVTDSRPLIDTTRHSSYTEPGAEPKTYTERLLTLPASETLFVNQAHFNEANVVAHVRHNDRIGPDGEKILFLEEIQSDWHQAGRQEGYAPKERENLQKEYDALIAEDPVRAYERWSESLTRFEKYQDDLKKHEPENQKEAEIKEELLLNSHIGHQERLQEGRELTAKINRMEELDNTLDTMGRTPNAPFKKSWPEFSMKRMLKLAADKGYDAIAWTRGDTQNARYQLGDKVTGIDVIDYGENNYELMVRMPNEDVFKTVETNISKEKLPDYIGKELTQRALDNMESSGEGMRNAVLEGENLRLGGKGMRGFYDDKLPKLKVFKQTKDANGKPLKVETKAISDDLEANYVALDDTVRSKISSQGLPRYSVKRGDLWDIPKSQEFTSANTSINQSKTPATFGRVKWKRGTVNADIGGGKFDNATKMLAGKGVKNLIYDPFNRTRGHNANVAKQIGEGGADTATVNNVLNVIKEPANRHKVIAQASDAIKLDGEAYFLIYEGNKTSQGAQTKAGYQNNLKAKDYIKEISRYFGKVTQRGNLLVASKPKKADANDLPGFNVKSEPNMPFADLILTGRKTIETRAKPTLNSLIGRRVKLIETTGKGSGEVKGEVTVGEPKFYRTKAEFDADMDKHFVQDSSEFAFGAGGKWGYPIKDPVIYQEPYETNTVLDKPKGRVLTRSVPGNRYSPSRVSDEFNHLRVGTSRDSSKNAKATEQTSNISGEIVPRQILEDHLSKMDYDHVPDEIKSIADLGQKREAYIDWMVDNLLALHDAFPADLREIATLWYDGANLIANNFATTFNYKPEQSAGVLAVLSPQKNWFMNVAQAEQVMDIWQNHKKTVLTEELIGAQFNDIVNAAQELPKNKRKAKPGESKLAKTRRTNYNKRQDQKAKDKRRRLLSPILNSTIESLGKDKKLQAWAIRILAQSVHGREYRVINPDGTPMQIDVKKDGGSQKNGWGSTGEIVKAVSILEDGTLENISNQLGNEHKVRNFFNNIIAPNNSFGDATIDTHAVAAGHLMPYGANAKPVGHNFGAGVKGAITGISGTYHLYLDAYKKAAKARGLQPRQMQSITWEAVRLLYPPETRRDKSVVDNAQNIWKNNDNDNARQKIVGGTLPAPSWASAIDGGKPKGVSKRLPKKGSKHDSGGGLLFRGGGYRDVKPGGPRFSPVRRLNNRGGAIFENPLGFRAVQTSSRAGVRVYSDKGRRIGPVFNSVEKAQDHLERLMNN